MGKKSQHQRMSKEVKYKERKQDIRLQSLLSKLEQMAGGKTLPVTTIEEEKENNNKDNNNITNITSVSSAITATEQPQASLGVISSVSPTTTLVGNTENALTSDTPTTSTIPTTPNTSAKFVYTHSRLQTVLQVLRNTLSIYNSDYILFGEYLTVERWSASKAIREAIFWVEQIIEVESKEEENREE